jgi:PAS domain S-box-containing protein
MTGHVLIVEDNRALAENLAELFADAGVSVSVCGTGAEALAAAHGTALAVVDVRLPDTTGVALLPRLREHMPGGEVILMTGDASLATAIAAVREGVFAYVQKPFAPEDLLALGVRALAQVQLRRERQRLASELAVSERLYRGVVESVESLIVGIDRDGAIRMWNRCATQITGWEQDELLGHPFIDIVIAEAQREQCHIGMKQAWRDRRLLEHECGVLTREGRHRTVRWSAAAMATEGEGMEMLLLVGNDVTERLALEKRAADAEAMSSLATLTAGLAHEIRNPLNAALLQLELLGRIGSRVADASQRERIGDCARLVQSEIRRLTRLLEEFLSLARPRTLERYPVDVRALLDYVATMQRPLAEIAHIELQVVVPDGLPRVLGDQPKLTQVLINLVVNAIDAMREAGMRGTIELRGEAVGDRVCIRVADTGPGIDERVAKDLFRPFVSTKEMGTGLGLSIAKRIIDQHGGTVELGPRPGGGTVASVLLQTVPAADPE